jgi:hypothetical protein
MPANEVDQVAERDEAQADVAAPTADTAAAKRQAEEEAGTALARAAELAVALGVTLDAFMGAAYASYLRANPGLRRDIADTYLLTRMSQLKRRGGVAEA